MELAELEQLALGTDRAAALAALLPGTTEHDYWRGVLLQHEGRLDEVDALLHTWAERHRQQDELYERLERRQLLVKAQRDLAAVRDEIRERTGTTLDDRAEVVVQAERFPTRLDPALIADRAVLHDAVRRRKNLDDVTDALIPDIVRDPSLVPHFERVRRAALQRLRRVDLEGLVDLLARDLENRDGSNERFGALPVHALLTRAQLTALAECLPYLEMQPAWVDAMLARLAPPAWVDLRTDREARADVLAEAYAFAAPLAASFNTLKATLLYHQLDLDRAAGVYDRIRFRAYVALPRRAPWVLRGRLESLSNDALVQPGVGAAQAVGLDPIYDDEPLVRDFLSRFLLEDEPKAWSDLLDAEWLAKLAATARLLAGATGAEAERAAKVLGAAERDALKGRVDIELAPQNRPWYAATDHVTLEVDLKNVPELELKVFRIDALAYWLAKNAEVDTSIDLDGMVPSGEQRRLRVDAPPVRRQRIRLDFPECTRPGTYVIELIGNGRSSRALLRKGALRHLVRTTAAGLAVTVTDEDGQPLPDARLWLAGRELTPRDGEITIPFGTSGGSTPVLLVHGDVVQRAIVDRPIEHAVLGAGFHVERETLVANQTARILACPRLTLGGAPASLALLENARVEISVAKLDGTSTSRTHSIELDDDRDLAFDLPIPEGATRLVLSLHAQLRIASRQETTEVADTALGPLNVVQSTELTAVAHLARVAGPNPSAGAPSDHFVLSVLGKTGEPLAARAVSLALHHRAVHSLLHVTLETDERGQIALGALEGQITKLEAALPDGRRRSWEIGRVGSELPRLVHAVEGQPIALPRPASARAVTDLAFLEQRRGANTADLAERIALEPHAIILDGLAPGEYRLEYPDRGARASTHLVVAPRPSDAAAAHRWILVRDVLLERSRPEPLVRRFEIEGNDLVLRLDGVTADTRVHFIATHFVSDRAVTRSTPDPTRAPRSPQATRLARNCALYVSGRDIGDEYRYVLERRKAPRRPGMMLEKPSLLLHPWALRTTETDRIDAALGGAYGAPPPAAAAPMPAMRAASRGLVGAASRAPEEVPGLASVDFLPASATVVSNQRPDGEGVVRLPLADLGEDAQRVEVLVVDPLQSAPVTAELALPTRPLRARDLRLRLALDPERHFYERRSIDGAPAETTLVVPDIRTGSVELVATIARAHQLLLTRMDDRGEASDRGALQELAFVTDWPSLDEPTKRARYGKYACHELNLFLARKDRAFFEAVIRPALLHKREKAVVDRFLLGEDLTPFLDPWAFGRLNTVERILVASAIPAVRASIARLIGDAVDLLAPDPEGDAQLVATLLGSASLEVGGGAMPRAAFGAAEAPLMSMALDEVMESAPMPDDDSTGSFERAKTKKGGRTREAYPSGSRGGGGGALRADLVAREEAAPMYRGADKTQEWAEVQWWRRRIDEIDASLVEPNRFWRDLARHLVAGSGDVPFLSPHIGLCQRNFAEAMCALAFIDLPFVATPAVTTLEDTRLTLTPKSHALAASSSLVEIPAPVEPNVSILIGQSYVRSDDRWEWHDGEQREKRVTGEMIVGVVYRCIVVVTNPSSATEKLEVLLQIPKGAMPVDSGFITRTMPMSLDPYATQSFDYAFYFPAPGAFSHFPAHVTKNAALVAFAAGRELTVVRQPSSVDLRSWSHVSQHGSLAEVLAHLHRNNLGRTDLQRIAWRMTDAEAFHRVTELLAARHVYDDRIWSYALLHGDRTRGGEWLRHQDEFLRPGFLLEGLLEPAERAWYQHLEYAPLVNARAHQLGARRRIANRALDAQYRRFLDSTAHRARPTSDDLLVAAHYLLAMDRVDDALPLVARISEAEVTARLQYDYLRAYVACYRGDVNTARELATPWLGLGVERWRARFAALVGMIDEMSSTEQPTITDLDSRDQKMAAAAAKQPSLDIAVRGGDIHITQANLATCQLRFFKLDIELVFSRQPFVQSDVERFSFIEPGLVVDVLLDGPKTTVPLPKSLEGANVVIEAVAPGLRRSVAHYAHDLGVQVAHTFGQLKVVRASTGAPLPAVYVKVYSRERGGRVVFFKDGYTDLRGRLDYATLSTDDLDRTERFALLIVSDDAGATITEAPPPAR